MIVAGIDIGSRATKAVLLNKASVLSSVICDTGPESVKTSEAAMQVLLRGTGVSLKEVKYTVATGYGRILVPFANENVSEISCHARGVNHCFPSVRTILDMGGQDCKAIRCDEQGRVVNFIMNDKCAGGTGRFLEIIAEVLDVPLSGIGGVALESKSNIPFNTICAVFAKSEAISYLRKGASKGGHPVGAPRGHRHQESESPQEGLDRKGLQHQRRDRQEQRDGAEAEREDGAGAAAGGGSPTHGRSWGRPVCQGAGPEPEWRWIEDTVRLCRCHRQLLHHR